jgi:hypothetical protein
MTLSDHETENPTQNSQPLSIVSWGWVTPPPLSQENPTSPRAVALSKPRLRLKPLRPIRAWLDQIEVQNVRLAHLLCQWIPAQCPFERDVQLFGRVLFHIPPLCKLNPFYDEVVALRFRALCYLADECGEDIMPYC